jgi:archaellum component FlaC
VLWEYVERVCRRIGRGAGGRTGQKVEDIDARLGAVEARLDRVETRLGKVEAGLEGVRADIAGLRRDLPGIIAETMREMMREGKQPQPRPAR